MPVTFVRSCGIASTQALRRKESRMANRMEGCEHFGLVSCGYEEWGMAVEIDRISTAAVRTVLESREVGGGEGGAMKVAHKKQNRV
ncbi:unnamed protein product [Cylicostephanus goldi]|uniref:Uncharacterized protein n=1 Tax=Cylicostephanus goldi TaxID=71465 RepID=A0A3P7M0A1_CYLGO|nr:unnamed protein product [Cylicostephanus goldi]